MCKRAQIRLSPPLCSALELSAWHIIFMNLLYSQFVVIRMFITIIFSVEYGYFPLFDTLCSCLPNMLFLVHVFSLWTSVFVSEGLRYDTIFILHITLLKVSLDISIFIDRPSGFHMSTQFTRLEENRVVQRWWLVECMYTCQYLPIWCVL